MHQLEEMIDMLYAHASTSISFASVQFEPLVSNSIAADELHVHMGNEQIVLKRVQDHYTCPLSNKWLTIQYKKRFVDSIAIKITTSNNVEVAFVELDIGALLQQEQDEHDRYWSSVANITFAGHAKKQQTLVGTLQLQLHIQYAAFEQNSKGMKLM